MPLRVVDASVLRQTLISPVPVNRIKTPGVSGAQPLAAGAAGDGPGAESLNRRGQLGADGLARRVAGWLLLLSGALSGIGIGLAQAAMTDTIIESVPASPTGIATSVNAIVRTIGGLPAS